MKKGFTLIELLIVMVLVGTLVTIALPKYQRALERGRALEGINNLRAATDYANAYYLTHNETYPSTIPTSDLIKSKFFGSPSIVEGEGTSEKPLKISVGRKSDSGWDYTVVSVNINGEIVGSYCAPSSASNDCEKLDLNHDLLRE